MKSTLWKNPLRVFFLLLLAAGAPSAHAYYDQWLTRAPGAPVGITVWGAPLLDCFSATGHVIANPVTVGGYNIYGYVMSHAMVGQQETLRCFHSDGTISEYYITVVAPLGVTLSAVPQLTHNSATFSATTDAAAIGYWLVRPKGADGAPPATPTAAEIFAATGKGSATLAATPAAAITLSGLTADTDYWLFFFARETTSNFDTPVQVRQFHTPAIPVPQEVLTGTASGSYDAFNLSTTITPQSALLNQQGNYYLRADVPGLGVFSLVNTSSGQGQWNPGMHNYFTANTALGTQPVSVLSNFALMPLFSQLAGTTITAGYITESGVNNSKRVYTIANSLPTLTATPVSGQNKLTVTFGGSAAQAWWQRLDAGATACPAAAAVKQANPANSLTASAELPLTGLAPDTPYTVCFAVEDATGILGSSTATVPTRSLTGVLALEASAVQNAPSATLAVQSNGTGLLFWRVRPVGETAAATADTLKAQGRVVPQRANQPSRIVLTGLTPNVANPVDIFVMANGAETAVQTVTFAATALGVNNQFTWATVGGNLQATIAPAGITAGDPGHYYVYVVLPGVDNTLIFARDNAGSAGGHAQTFQQDNQLQPYFTDSAMAAMRMLALLPTSVATAPAFSGVEVYAGYRIGTTANDPVYWGYLHTFSASVPTTTP